MRSALYYPHTSIHSISLLKSALLFWDTVYTIVPNTDFRHQSRRAEIGKATDLLIRSHVPSEGEKEATHELIEDFATRLLPAAFFYKSTRQEQQIYEIYPQKLLHKSWRLLEEARLSSKFKNNPDAIMTRPVGLSLMSLLADSCAGDGMSRITDQADAYASLAGLLHGSSNKPDEVKAMQQLVPVTLQVVDTRRLRLADLVRFREREDKEGAGSTLRKLRHSYADTLTAQAKELSRAKSDLVRKAITNEFHEKMKGDLHDLKSELGCEARSLALTGGFLLTVISAVGSIAAQTVSLPDVFGKGGAAATVGGLLATQSKFAQKRREVLAKHPMSYLYEMRGGVRW